MAGFRNLKEYVEAEDNGQYHVALFRKANPGTTVNQSKWLDLIYSGGSPTAHFYASSPLEAALIPRARGFDVPNVAPARQVLRNIKIQSLSRSSTQNSNDRNQMILCDYLLYYPFIDMDATGDPQTLINDVALPERYPEGGQVVAVGQSANPGGGAFTFTYTNQDGTSGRVAPTQLITAVNGGGQVVGGSITNSNNGLPFCMLQGNDTGVRSIEDVTFTVAGGGLMAFAIVKPLLTFYLTQVGRRDNTLNISFGACDEFAGLINIPRLPIIKDDAVLSILGCGHNGTADGMILTGIIETAWN